MEYLHLSFFLSDLKKSCEELADRIEAELFELYPAWGVEELNDMALFA